MTSNNDSSSSIEILGSEECEGNSLTSLITTFDKAMAAKHEYLGTNLEDIGGRTFHDEGSIIWIPILMEVEVVLVPGQTLPLTAIYPPTVSMLQKIIAEDKTFGVMCVNSLAQYGTTAEIFQYQEDSESSAFKIKAKGRQRFKLLEQKLQAQGLLLGKVLILPEINLVNPLQLSKVLSLNCYRKNSSLKNIISCYDAASTPWPSCFFKQYDTDFLIKLIISKIKDIHTDICSLSLPADPIDLSYWIIQFLPIDSENRVRLLSFNAAIERFQYALTLLSKCHKLYCLNCGNCIADRKDIFSMSTDGPQGMYCNPGGYVHDVLTVWYGRGLIFKNENPSVEFSWFPGYGWIIAQCSNCDCHIGWLFIAMESHLKPEKFWGLSRRSVTTHVNKIASCETQGPSGSKYGSGKGTPARKRKTFDILKGRKNSTESGGGQGGGSISQTRCGLRVYKVVVLGDGGVGKSALTLQFVSHSFSEYHDPTIEDAYQQQAVIDGEAALLDILDTAGQIEFNAMRDQYMRCGEGFIICYSVTDRHSFQEAVEYKKLINKVRASEDIPLILIGNKCDLQHQRKVSTEEGHLLAQQFGCPFFETSAALRHFVDDAFHTLIREIRAKEKGRRSADKLHFSKWKRLRSILSVIFKRRNNYSY